MHRFANPSRFMRLSAALLPWLGAATAVADRRRRSIWRCSARRADYQQGESVRIMYVHVPAAWMAMFCYAVMAGASGGRADLEASAGRPRGQGGGADRRRLHAARPDHRLAVGQADVGHLVGVGRAADLGADPVLPLSRLYRADARLRRSDAAADRAAAILALVGVVNVPIIKFSVDWWNTLHQPAQRLPPGRADDRPQHAVAAAADGCSASRRILGVSCCCGCAPKSSPARSARCACARCTADGWPQWMTWDSLSADFFAMGGYAAYVWPAYRRAAVVLIGLLCRCSRRDVRCGARQTFVRACAPSACRARLARETDQ